jgi:hypothetical protein
MTTTTAVKVGRFARGTVALAALGVTGFATLVLLTWSCCGSPKEPFSNPLVWTSIASMPVAIAAIPFVSSRLRGTGVRWSLLPLALVDLAACGYLAYLSIPKLLEGGSSAMEALSFIVPAWVPNSICAIYVMIRVVFAKPNA